ncbi:hypothetical protein CCACVL1_00400, partial [Corchorus capsularis]
MAAFVSGMKAPWLVPVSPPFLLLAHLLELALGYSSPTQSSIMEDLGLSVAE